MNLPWAAVTPTKLLTTTVLLLQKSTGGHYNPNPFIDYGVIVYNKQLCNPTPSYDVLLLFRNLPLAIMIGITLTAMLCRNLLL